MKKKLLFVAWALISGGAERALVNLLNELPPDKFDIDLMLIHRDGLYLNQVPDSVNIIDPPEDIKKLYWGMKDSKELFFTKTFGTIFSKAKEKNYKLYRWGKYYSKKVAVYPKHYDVAVAFFSGEIGAFVAEKIDADKKIVFVHSDYIASNMPKKYELQYFQKMDYVVAISETCKRSIETTFSDLVGKVIYLPNITSSSLIKKKASLPLSQELKGENILLSIGRLSEEKGFDLAIDAAKLLKDRAIEYSWYLIGEGALKEQLLEQIKKLDLSNRFILLGAKENPYPYLSRAKIVVQPSRYEGKSMVLDEAKILSKPIVVTNYPTAKDQIKQGDEGLIVEMTAEGIADGIQTLLTDQALYNHIQSYLQSNEYGNEESINKYIELFS